MAEFFTKLPKVELHAHINGSISEKTMEYLIQQKGQAADTNWRTMFKKGEISKVEEIFKMFKLIHHIADNEEATYRITYDVIHEFAAENVKYLELRTTPREEPATGMTMTSHIESVLKAITDSLQEESLDIVVRLLLAIDRRRSVELAHQTVELAMKYREKSGGIVVGIDLSGDPYVGNAADFIPVFREARKNNLKLALHLAEVPAPQETLEVLQKIIPDRIGHGCALRAEDGGTDKIEEIVLKNKIPLELCLTSNIISQVVDHFDNHHFQFWYDKNHPCVICTDDKGVFSTTVSDEYAIAADTFNLKPDKMWNISKNSIDYIFADDKVKDQLREKWRSLKSSVFSCIT